jgi:hypothetical protein
LLGESRGRLDAKPRLLIDPSVDDDALAFFEASSREGPDGRRFSRRRIGG